MGLAYPNFSIPLEAERYTLINHGYTDESDVKNETSRVSLRAV